jgi:methionine-rich copper-binding protein CopC
MRARILLAAAGLLLGGLGAARAHAFLDHAQPRVGSTVKVAPKELRLWFTDDLDPAGTSVALLDAAGKAVTTAKPIVDAKDDMVLVLALPVLPPGRYKVVWQATCPQGHVTKGDFAFLMKP